MKALSASLHELWGLFVEDPRFTLALIIVLGIAIVVVPAVHLRPDARGPVLFVLLAIALVENVLHAARR
jgi:hypothetical protein